MRRRARLVPLIASCAIAVGTASCTKYVFVDADALCKSWKHQTVSKDDKLTQDTAAIAQGNNKSRPEWQCEYGENRAKG